MESTLQQTATRLEISNDNNKLYCDAFTHISLAPPKESIKESDFDRVFVIARDGIDIYVKLLVFTRIKFCNVSDIICVPAHAMESYQWRPWFKKKYPGTTNETELAVYCYTRIE